MTPTLIATCVENVEQCAVLFETFWNFAEGIKELLGDDLCAYSNRDIARQLDKSGFGLQFYSISDTNNGIAHIGISPFQDGQKLRLNDRSLYGGG